MHSLILQKEPKNKSRHIYRTQSNTSNDSVAITIFTMEPQVFVKYFRQDCPLCGTDVSVYNLKRHQKSNMCKKACGKSITPKSPSAVVTPSKHKSSRHMARMPSRAEDLLTELRELDKMDKVLPCNIDFPQSSKKMEKKKQKKQKKKKEVNIDQSLKIKHGWIQNLSGIDGSDC